MDCEAYKAGLGVHAWKGPGAGRTDGLGDKSHGLREMSTLEAQSL